MSARRTGKAITLLIVFTAFFLCAHFLAANRVSGIINQMCPARARDAGALRMIGDEFVAIELIVVSSVGALPVQVAVSIQLRQLHLSVAEVAAPPRVQRVGVLDALVGALLERQGADYFPLPFGRTVVIKILLEFIAVWFGVRGKEST